MCIAPSLGRDIASSAIQIEGYPTESPYYLQGFLAFNSELRLTWQIIRDIEEPTVPKEKRIGQTKKTAFIRPENSDKQKMTGIENKFF